MLIFDKKQILMASLGYIYIPIVIFLFGWTKPCIAVVCCSALLFGIVALYQDYTKGQSDNLSIKKGSLFVVLFFFLLVGYYAGWGRFTEQSSDWWKHNAILSDLVNRSWPVYYANEDEHSMLTYYLGQYMIPALFGKVCHSYRVAEIVTFIWAELGLLLVYLNLIRILRIRKKYMQWISAGLLCFFNEPLVLAQRVAGWMYPELKDMLSDCQWFVWQNDIQLQYSNHFVMLRWVFPQVLVIWLCLLFFYEHKNLVRHYIALLMPCAFFGILSFAGILPFAVGHAFLLLYREKCMKKWIQQVLSLQNFLIFSTFGIVLILYYYGNILSEKPAAIGFRKADYEGKAGIYIVFIVCMVLLYCGCIFWENRKNACFYIAVLSLTIIPVFRMGRFNDWVMRCSIPALFIFYILIIKFLNNHLTDNMLHWQRKEGRMSNLSVTMLVIFLAVGLFSPLQELSEIIVSDHLMVLGSEMTGTMEVYANRELPQLQGQEDLVYNYFSYDTENNIFCQFIARDRD